MNQLNSLIIEGNVVRQPEMRETANGFKTCTVPLAVNRFYKNSQGEGVNEVSYFNVETYGKMAEVCEKNCEKGRGLRVVGRLKQNRWKNQEGKTASRVTIIAEHMEFKKKISKPETEDSLSAIAEANQAALEEEIQMETIENTRMAENEDSAEAMAEEAVF